MEACPDFEQAAHSSLDFRRPRSGSRDSRQQLQQSRLARSVPPDQAYHFALLNLEGDVLERPEKFARRSAQAIHRRTKRPRQHIAQRAVPLALADGVSLAQLIRPDDWSTHSSHHVRNCGFHLLKVWHAAE